MCACVYVGSKVRSLLNFLLKIRMIRDSSPSGSEASANDMSPFLDEASHISHRSASLSKQSMSESSGVVCLRDEALPFSRRSASTNGVQSRYVRGEREKERVRARKRESKRVKKLARQREGERVRDSERVRE